jgi:hypothetical protein
MIDLLTRSQLHCKVLLVCQFVSRRVFPIEGVKRIRIVSDRDHPANIIVTRFRSNNEDQQQERRFQVYGEKRFKIKKEETADKSLT